MKDHEIIELYWARNESAITATAEKYGNYCHNQLCKLYDTIWGNTGCESGICPF